MSRSEYDRLFDQILAQLDPAKIYQEIDGDRTVILCYESPNVWCHRRRVAEWFEQSLGIVVPEMEFDRSFSIPYATMTDEAPKATKATKAKPERVMQKGLFD